MDVSNDTDRERQFELHVTVREHVPVSVAMGIHAGIDMSDKHTFVVGMSDGSTATLTLREKDTLRNIARIQKKTSHCKLHSHKWRGLHAQLQSICRKMGNRQTDKLRKFARKPLMRCDKIIMEGMNLRTMTTKGPGQKAKNHMMRQSKQVRRGAVPYGAAVTQAQHRICRDGPEGHFTTILHVLQHKHMAQRQPVQVP